MKSKHGTISWEILDRSDTDSLFLELKINGQSSVRAYLETPLKNEIVNRLEVSEDDLKEDFAEAMRSNLINPMTPIIKHIKRDAENQDIYHALALSQSGRTVKGSLIWYDFGSSETGPDDASAVARNLLRTEVHKTLFAAQNA